jgi:hypothetical protein
VNGSAIVKCPAAIRMQAEQTIGDPAAGHREQIHAGGVDAVDRGRGLVVEPEAAGLDAGDHRQHQDRAHAVVAEALPHLGEEERGEAARMSGPGLVGHFSVMS